MTTALRVLILEDTPSDAELMIRELRRVGFDPSWQRVETEADYAAQLAQIPDLILADFNLPQFDALRALHILHARELDIPFLVVTGSIGEEVAVDCLKRGASDYLLKDRLTRLGPAVIQALDQKRLRDERRRAILRIQHLNQMLRAIRHVNQLIVKERDPERLLVEVCRSLVQTRGFRLAWVGRVEAGHTRVLPAARAGVETDYLDNVLVTWDEAETGRNPVGTALRTRQPAITQDIASDPRFLPSKDAALSCGYVSVASIPLVHGERLFGALTVCADHAQAFDDEEMALLVELADDLGLALRSIEDETARKRQEDDLRLQGVALEAAANAIVITDREGRIIWANSAFTHLTGYPLVECIERNPRFLKSGIHDRSFYQHLWETILAGCVWHGELINRRKDGKLYTEEMTITPVRTVRGEITHFIAIKQDVTERRRAEEMLATRTLQLESVRTVTAEITQELDLTTLLNLINRRATELVGASTGALFLWDESAQLLLPQAWHGQGDWLKGLSFRLGEGLTGTAAARRETLVVNDYPACEWAHPAVLGHVEATAALAQPLLYRDRLLGVITVNHEEPGRGFTEEDRNLLTLLASQASNAIENTRLYQEVQRHAAHLEARVVERTQELEIANEELKSASRHKSEFLANMSHELRTPLNSILGFAQILLEQTGETLSPKQTRFLTNVFNSGQHLLQLINDILDLSKVEAGKFVLQPERLHVAEALEDILVIARGLASKKGQTIRVESAPNLPWLRADPVRFKQILFNLLSNAVKFTPERGMITVTARIAEGIADFRFPISDLKNGHTDLQSQIENQKSKMLEIAVTDTGIGIKAEDLPRLFQEFVQLQTTQVRSHEGTGLGLALTKRLVEMHGGRVWAESPGEGRGSTFTVLLPLTAEGS